MSYSRSLELAGDRLASLVVGFFLVASVALGGAGEDYPLLNMILRVLAAGVLAYFASGTHGRELSRAAAMPLALLTAMVALPLLQLIPLPPAISEALPGREVPVLIRSLTGVADQWFPLSLDPDATKGCALDLLPGAAAFVAVIHLKSDERLFLIHLALCGAITSCLLGALQIATGADPLVTPFPSTQSINGAGLFVNRNHQADLLIIGVILATTAGVLTAIQGRSSTPRIAAIGAVLLLSAGAVATRSRTGMVLLVPVLGWSIFVLSFTRVTKSRLLIGSLILGGLFWTAAQSSAVQLTLSRYSQEKEVRFNDWPDALAAAERYFPVGSGLGTFEQVFRANESLDHLGSSVNNNAHNDYLELLIEAGVPAILLVALFLVFLLLRTRDILHGNLTLSCAMLSRAALIGIVVLMLHSVIDYPLRMISLEVLFAVFCGFLIPGASPVVDPRAAA